MGSNQAQQQAAREGPADHLKEVLKSLCLSADQRSSKALDDDSVFAVFNHSNV